MSLLGFGQPQTGSFQMAYVVEDIDASMRWWVARFYAASLAWDSRDPVRPFA
jgi:hypothetical protein